MSTTYEMGDASTPPEPPAGLPVWAPYIGGQTPHPWTDAEIKALKSRWALPIWVNVNPGADVRTFADEMLGWLAARHWPHGTTVCLDREDVDMATFINDLDGILETAGYLLMDYQSKGAIPGQPVPSGGLWVADWTGTPHMYPGARATQYADSAMLGLPWDGSLIDRTVPLCEIHPPVTRPIRTVPVAADMPELVRGDQGMAVRRLQGLLEAWRPAGLGPAGMDGVFGPDTLSALRAFQRVYGITTDAGTVTAETWVELLTG